MTVSEILPNLYIGTVNDVVNNAQSFDLKICVLNENDICPSGSIHLPVNILANNQIARVPKQNLEKIVNLIDDALKQNKKVVVFCIGGVDRSPFAVMWYLVTKRGMTPQEAYNFIKQKRPIIKEHYEWLSLVK